MKKFSLWLCLLALTALLVAAVCPGAAAAAAEPQSCYVHGDVDANGKVNDRDAVWTLYSTLLGAGAYPMNQDGDFNGDGRVNSQDAIYLLYATFGLADLKGNVHVYYDPAWAWSADNAAQVTFRCACGQSHTYTAADGVAVTKATPTAATCTQAGVEEYTAKFTLEGQEYTATCQVSLPATGHSLSGAATCTQGAACQNCDYTEAAKGHSLTAEGERSLGSCKWVKTYRCAACSQVLDGTAAGDTYYKHSHTSALTTEATCRQAGLVTYTCACGDSYTEQLPKDASKHVWGQGVTVGGLTTYTCACGETKTAQNAVNTPLTKEELSQAQTVELEGGVTLELDQAAHSSLEADRDIALSAQKVEPDDLGLSQAQQEQIGDGTLYDITMVYTDTQEPAEFEGSVTVTIPYTLAPGEGIENIDIWFLPDSGEPQRMSGTYANGYVTFVTTHFSKYCVTRLTDSELCARDGHTTVRREVEATCTQEGSVFEVCTRCGHVATDKKTPAGHSFGQAVVVPATCSARGTGTRTCAVCNYVETEFTNQLQHDLQPDAARSVPATCSAPGKQVNTCALCAYSVTTDLAPLGHSYTPQWTWAENGKTVTLTLVCGSDATHKVERKLTATTKDTVSCLGGTATYTASYYFGLTYTDSKAVTTTGGQHGALTDWQQDAAGHYKACSVCGQKQEEAAHTWGATTTVTAATCGAEGLQRRSCTVCGYNQESPIPATGSHSYKNGTCTKCGAKENCDHSNPTTTQVSLDSYGVCAGFVIEKTTCCQAYEMVAINEIPCDFGDGYTEQFATVDADGNLRAVAVMECSVCGLEVRLQQYYRPVAGGCQGDIVIEYAFCMDGQTVATARQVNTYSRREHPTVKYVSVESFSQDICGLELYNTTCFCGKISDVNIFTYCQWERDQNSGQEDVYVYNCTVCGAQRKEIEDWTWTEVDACTRIRTTHNEVYADGRLLTEFDTVNVGTSHQWEVTDYTLLGKTCDDGLRLDMECSDCGLTDTYTTTQHTTVITEKVAVTGICGLDGINVAKCPCPVAVRRDELSYSDVYNSCDWHYDDDASQGGQDVYTCTKCNTTDTSTWTQTGPDANCTVKQTTVSTYKNPQGKVLATLQRDEVYTEHDAQLLDREFRGETCEDGVDQSFRCNRCGDEWEDTEWTHDDAMEEVGRVTLSTNCSSAIVQYRCPCPEQYAEFEFVENGNASCGYELYESGENEQRCYECGLRLCFETELSDRVVGEEYSHCYRVKASTVTVYDGQGALLGTLTEKVEKDACEEAYSFILQGETCDDGVRVEVGCKYCGNEMYSMLIDSCETYLVQTVTLHDGTGLCGPVVLEKYACPCGRLQRAELMDSCDWFYGGEVPTCDTCGATQYCTETLVPGGTDPCLQTFEARIFYMQGETTLVNYTYRSTSEHHRYEYTFEMNGDTCDVSFYANGTCVNCGKANRYWGQGCEAYPVDQKLVYGGNDVCGPIYEGTYSCPCGSEAFAWVETSCAFDHGEGESTCPNCGARQVAALSEEELPATCQMAKVYTYRYTFSGGATATASSFTLEEWHDNETTYTLVDPQGSCMDGVLVEIKCKNCGQGYSDVRNYHVTTPLAAFDLQELGGKCPGTLTIAGCLCGENGSWRDTEGCDFESVYLDFDEMKGYTEDPDTGLWSIPGLVENGIPDGTLTVTSAGHITLWSSVDVDTCAVSDPEACGLQVRRLQYWTREENCRAVSHTVWLLGYDPATGEYKEIYTCPVVGEQPYHDYNLTTTGDSYHRITQGTCACGATYKEEYTRSDSFDRTEIWATEVLDNREYNEYHYIDEDLYIDSEYFDAKLDYTEITYPDGTQYWEKEEWSYSFEPTCSCVYTYTDSNGETRTETVNNYCRMHIIQSEDFESSCTQEVPHLVTSKCIGCGREETETLNSEPQYHTFAWQDGTYVCNRCGIRSTTGVNGSVVLEDLSQADTYVAGFVNYMEYALVAYIRVDGPEGSTVLSLEPQLWTPETNGMRAYAVSKAAVAEAAQAAGFTGEYTVTLVLHRQSDATLTYSITFDTNITE